MTDTSSKERPTTLTVYGSTTCTDCQRTRAFLNEHEIPYVWIDLSEHPEAGEIVERLNGGKRITPTLIFPDGSTMAEPSNSELAAKLNLDGRFPGGQQDDVRDLVIIGSGPAGYTAALYAARANLRPLVFAGYQHSGQLMLTTEIENFPGFENGILGPQLMTEMRAQAERFGAEMRDVDVTSVDFSKRPFTIRTDDEVVQAAAVVVATGANAKWLGIPGEEQFRGVGVSSCATCDGFFFRGKRVVVVGGGDVAMEEATFLSRFADVTVIHRRDQLRASKTMADRALNNPKVQFIWDTVVEEVLGSRNPETGIPRVTGLRVRNVKTGEESIVDTDAIFVAIGHEPNTEIFKGQIPLDEAGYALVVNEAGTATEVDGVFVAGDVHDKHYRQAVTAAAEGAKAAMDAERWLQEHGDDHVDLSGEIYVTEVVGAPVL